MSSISKQVGVLPTTCQRVRTYAKTAAPWAILAFALITAVSVAIQNDFSLEGIKKVLITASVAPGLGFIYTLLGLKKPKTEQSIQFLQEMHSGRGVGIRAKTAATWSILCFALITAVSVAIQNDFSLEGIKKVLITASVAPGLGLIYTLLGLKMGQAIQTQQIQAQQEIHNGQNSSLKESNELTIDNLKKHIHQLKETQAMIANHHNQAVTRIRADRDRHLATVDQLRTELSRLKGEIQRMVGANPQSTKLQAFAEFAKISSSTSSSSTAPEPMNVATNSITTNRPAADEPENVQDPTIDALKKRILQLEADQAKNFTHHHQEITSSTADRDYHLATANQLHTELSKLKDEIQRVLKANPRSTKFEHLANFATTPPSSISSSATSLGFTGTTNSITASSISSNSSVIRHQILDIRTVIGPISPVL